MPTEEETTIDSLPEHALKDIMLHLPTPAPLVRAAAVSKSWCRIIAARQFLSQYRERHPSSTFIASTSRRSSVGCRRS
jgi:hypothetical protein